MASAIEIQNNVHLEKLLTTDPTMEQYIKTSIAYVLEKARKDVMSDAAAALQSDPRRAARAVRRTLYKQILGGQINILRKKRAGKTATAPASSRGRLASTERIMSYQGSDRGFILRFINAGTKGRVATHMNGRSIQRTTRSGNRQYETQTIGSRGAISGKGFFGPSATSAIQEAATLLRAEFNKIVTQQFQ